MSRKLTAEDARQSLESHVAEKGRQIQDRYGPVIGWHELEQILADRTIVRYPCSIQFTTEGLQEGEFAYPEAVGERPEEGYVMRVHPYFASQPTRVPALVLYHLVTVNYGAFASPGDAETLGARALGLSRDDYYHRLCAAADELVEAEAGGPCGSTTPCHAN